tara:strand:+ start:52230 stop:52997 length:768 start_codon:yes stop_codon:yes gene_type:complete
VILRDSHHPTAPALRGPTVRVFDSAEAAAEYAADLVLEALAAAPGAGLGLATGSSPQRLYGALARRRAAGADFSSLSGFALDEYLGLPAEHPESYRSVIERDVIAPLGMDPDRVHVPPATDDPAVLAAFDARIGASGGIAVQILGIGGNGHIGFNEPGTPFSTRTHLTALSDSTRRANARFFDSLSDVPTHSVTQGIGTILESRRILLLATGAEKAEAVATAIESGITIDCPATALQLHENVTFVLDSAAAGRLS